MGESKIHKHGKLGWGIFPLECPYISTNFWLFCFKSVILIIKHKKVRQNSRYIKIILKTALNITGGERSANKLAKKSN